MKYVTGYIIYFGNSPISWKYKKQRIILISSSKAEYKVLTTTTCELHWLTYLLDDLKSTTKV